MSGHYVGATVRKRFGRRWFSGRVVCYDSAAELFSVTYNDGDHEELDLTELLAVLEGGAADIAGGGAAHVEPAKTAKERAVKTKRPAPLLPTSTLASTKKPKLALPALPASPAEEGDGEHEMPLGFSASVPAACKEMEELPPGFTSVPEACEEVEELPPGFTAASATVPTSDTAVSPAVATCLQTYNARRLAAITAEAARAAAAAAAALPGAKKSSQRPDLVALKDMPASLKLNQAKCVGALPGIRPGASFSSRCEMCVVGLHGHWLAGIDTCKLSREQSCVLSSRGAAEVAQAATSVAISVVLSGTYEDDEKAASGDESAGGAHAPGDVVYTGSGGNDLLGDKKQHADQKMTGANAALAATCALRSPVRLTRRHKCKASYTGALFVYEGTYTVVSCWEEKGASGFKVLKFRMRRCAGQPDATAPCLPVAQPSAPQPSAPRVANDAKAKGKQVPTVTPTKAADSAGVVSKPVFPMEDLALIAYEEALAAQSRSAPPPQLPPPPPLGGAGADAAAVGALLDALAVSSFLSIAGGALGLDGASSLSRLQRAVCAGGGDRLHSLMAQLAAGAGVLRKRHVAASLPELLRRALLRDGGARAGAGVLAAAATVLGLPGGMAQLQPPQVLATLRWLAERAVSRSSARQAVDDALSAAESAVKEANAGVAAFRKAARESLAALASAPAKAKAMRLQIAAEDAERSAAAARSLAASLAPLACSPVLFGRDRHMRCYFAFPSVDPAAVYTREDQRSDGAEGAWGVLTPAHSMAPLLRALRPRGKREGPLREALLARYGDAPDVDRDDAPLREAPLPEGVRGDALARAVAEEEAAGLQAAKGALSAAAKRCLRARVPTPGGWSAWASNAKACRDVRSLCALAAAFEAALHAALQDAQLELPEPGEECREESREGSSDDEEGQPEQEGEGEEGAGLWGSAGARHAWLQQLQQCATAACAAMLLQRLRGRCADAMGRGRVK